MPTHEIPNSQSTRNPSVRLRPAVASDVPLILAYIRELAIYEREPAAAIATEDDLLRDGFGAAPRFFVVLAEIEAQPVGFALYFFTYSTWQGKPALHLEDLFVRPEFRGQGAGAALLRHLAQEAAASGCTRFDWQVLDWNQPAIDFYERLGARILPGWQAVRLEGENLKRLAEASVL